MLCVPVLRRSCLYRSMRGLRFGQVLRKFSAETYSRGLVYCRELYMGAAFLPSEASILGRKPNVLSWSKVSGTVPWLSRMRANAERTNSTGSRLVLLISTMLFPNREPLTMYHTQRHIPWLPAEAPGEHEVGALIVVLLTCSCYTNRTSILCFAPYHSRSLLKARR